MDEEDINYNEADEYDTTEVVVESGVDEDINSVMKGYKSKLKSYKTSPSLTKYERCKVISERANQINHGSHIFIQNPERFNNAYDIAVQELNEKLIPFIIKRPYGNGFEYWKLNDLL
uniref:DNA-directed RNA polymerase n=1 Tax=viral metagenome TaxID=1070528 RepID=A0A6C0FFI8_9ZZZZ|tara:strand:- start:22786 stop:23136 length:351 start_codon:yes stop_codon:yes gene_type:complete